MLTDLVQIRRLGEKKTGESKASESKSDTTTESKPAATTTKTD